MDYVQYVHESTQASILPYVLVSCLRVDQWKTVHTYIIHVVQVSDTAQVTRQVSL